MISEQEAFAAVPRGSFLDAYMRYAAQCTDANAAYHILGGLIALSQTIPDNLGIPLGDNHLFGNLYGVVVGPSTESRKSVAITICKKLLQDAEVGLIAESPGSWEGMSESLRAASRQLVVYPEFGAFLSASEQGYQHPLRTLYTDVYDGSDIGRALAKTRRGVIKNPRLSILGGSTIIFLEQHTSPVDWEGGFLGRFFTIYSDRERTFTLQPPKVQGRKELIERLQTLNGVESFGQPCLGLHPQARKLWDQWFYDTERRMKASAHATRAAFARSHGMALKIALLLAWDRGDPRGSDMWYVTDDLLQYAIQITELHIRSVLTLGDNLAPSKTLRDRKTIIRVVRDHGPLSTGSIISFAQIGIKKYVTDHLSSLEEERILRRVETPNNRNDYWDLVEEDERVAADNVVRCFKPAPELDAEGGSVSQVAAAGEVEAPDLDV